MSLYAAIDLHSTNSVLAVIDQSGRHLLDRRRPNDLAAILADLAPFRDELAGVAVESTYNWYWLVDGLMDHGHVACLVNTAAVPQYDGLKHGNDQSDARHLAELMRLGILPTGYIYPREQRAARDLLRRRFALVRQAVRLMLSIQSSVSRATGRVLSGNALKQITGPQLEALFPDPTTRYGVLGPATQWADTGVGHVCGGGARIRRAGRASAGDGPGRGACLVGEAGAARRRQPLPAHARRRNLVGVGEQAAARSATSWGASRGLKRLSCRAVRRHACAHRPQQALRWGRAGGQVPGGPDAPARELAAFRVAPGRRCPGSPASGRRRALP
ncbi:IS110 family transposase [Frateuria hangzhouensis]|uniref:IS110 family transposase n=1 Tax=Frateuria hangzhouensis TaxID=2995589 RepID=UPI0022608E38|nr:transposase [Frateuria sp. STR12]MCX7513439.1 transposase [Frateuria sp. STR12]